MTAVKRRPALVADTPPTVDMEVTAVTDLPLTWDFDFNCRAPSPTSKAYKDMVHTLQEEPKAFFDRNEGIHVANGKHVMDGGHTYFALKHARTEGWDMTGVYVKVYKYEDLTAEKMAEKSKYLNNKVTPPLHGEKDLLGEFDGLKKHLPNKYQDLFEFRPNTKPAAPFKVGMLVALLNGITADTALRSYTTKGVLVRLYKDDKYALVLKHIGKAITLYSRIATDLAADKKLHKVDGVNLKRDMVLPDGSRVNPHVPEGLIWPLYGAFALLMDEDGNWLADPVEAWGKARTKMVSQLLSDLKNDKVGNNHYNRLGKSREAYLSQQRWVRA